MSQHDPSDEFRPDGGATGDGAAAPQLGGSANEGEEEFPSVMSRPGGTEGGDRGAARRRDALRRAVEALVLVAEEPLPAALMAQLLEVPHKLIDELCEELAVEFEEQGRGFQMARVAGGWRFQSHPDQALWVERMVVSGQSSRLSAAALESLAIVAYKQPISRAQVGAIRGVNPDGVLRTLQQRGYITEVARDPGPGQASLYGTTPLFLERLGLDSLADLPPVADFVPGPEVVEALEIGLRVDDEAPTPPEAGPAETGSPRSEGDGD